jgi:hypothetical protein
MVCEPLETYNMLSLVLDGLVLCWVCCCSVAAECAAVDSFEARSLLRMSKKHQQHSSMTPFITPMHRGRRPTFSHDRFTYPLPLATSSQVMLSISSNSSQNEVTQQQSDVTQQRSEACTNGRDEQCFRSLIQDHPALPEEEVEGAAVQIVPSQPRSQHPFPQQGLFPPKVEHPLVRVQQLDRVLQGARIEVARFPYLLSKPPASCKSVRAARVITSAYLHVL